MMSNAQAPALATAIETATGIADAANSLATLVAANTPRDGIKSRLAGELAMRVASLSMWLLRIDQDLHRLDADTYERLLLPLIYAKSELAIYSSFGGEANPAIFDALKRAREVLGWLNLAHLSSSDASNRVINRRYRTQEAA